MKKVLLLLVFLYFTHPSASQVSNFAVLNGKLVWENVIIAREDNIPAMIATHAKLSVAKVSDVLYRGKASGLTSSCDDTSNVLKNEYNFNFEIEMSDGKYRVTITDIVFSGKRGGKAERFYTNRRNDTLKTKGVNSDLSCLDAYFTKLFTMTGFYKTKS